MLPMNIWTVLSTYDLENKRVQNRIFEVIDKQLYLLAAFNTARERRFSGIVESAEILYSSIYTLWTPLGHCMLLATATTTTTYSLI